MATITKAQDQVTVLDVSDAYNVTLSNEAASFKATAVDKMGTAGTATTTVQAFCGTEQVSCTVNKDACTKPTGVTVGTDGKSPWPTLTITVDASVSAGGVVKIPVVIGSEDKAVTINKDFSFSIALKGQPGTNGTSVTVSKTEYQAGTSNTTAPTGSWSTNPVNVSEGQYLWTKVTYSDNKVAYSVAKQGKSGTNGTNGKDGANGKDGKDGANGKDAILLSITSSQGTIFRNNSGSTVLTAHVFQGGTELNATQIAALGSINWYKNGGTTVEGTGTTLNVDADDIDNKAVFTAQLEG